MSFPYLLSVIPAKAGIQLKIPHTRHTTLDYAQLLTIDFKHEMNFYQGVSTQTTLNTTH
jgi:hypothetical protein